MKGFQILFLLIFVTGCSSISNSQLAGNWQAVSIEIDGQSINADISEVILSFDKNGGYNYSSTLNYQESGFYQVAEKFLYTIDTLNQGSSEKKVEILEFSTNLMTMKMQEGEEERLIKFKRQ